MKHYIIFTAAIFLSHAAFAVDLDHWFNTNSITTKPVRSDYNSDEAYAADAAVYGIPRTCTWITRGYTDVNEGSISDFQLGNNLRKSRTGSWYAITVKPRFAGSSLRGFIYVNGDTGAIACGEDHLKYQGGSWSDGKWYKTFDLVLKTSHTGVTGSRKTDSPNDVGSVNEAVLSKGLMERLSKLKKLLDAGLINKSDYEKKKNEILNDL